MGNLTRYPHSKLFGPFHMFVVPNNTEGKYYAFDAYGKSLEQPNNLSNGKEHVVYILGIVVHLKLHATPEVVKHVSIFSLLGCDTSGVRRF